MDAERFHKQSLDELRGVSKEQQTRGATQKASADTLHGATNGRADAGDGRADKHEVASVILEFENRTAPSVGYGQIIGWPAHDPSRGIQLIFDGAWFHGWDSWEAGTFIVSIYGSNLEELHHKLCATKQWIIREGKDSIRKIEVKKWVQPDEENDH